MPVSLRRSPSFLLLAVARVHRSILGPRLAEFGLHPGADLLLLELWREDDLTQSQLAERLGVSAPNVTKLVRGLDQAGLLRKMGDPGDARVTRIHLTTAGLALRGSVERAWLEAERATFSRLSHTDLERLRALLARALGPGA